MHYTQIASVCQQLGILQAEISHLDVSMSSLLSEDIRTNPDSLFVKERPGIYALSPKGIAGLGEVNDGDVDASAALSELHVRTGISERSELLNKALYLTGRTLDMAGAQGVVHYRSLDMQQSIEINIVELEKDFAAHVDELGRSLFYEFPLILRRAKQTSCRLALKHAWLVIPLSLFLLDLAIDLVGTGSILVVKSDKSSIKIPVRFAADCLATRS